MEMTGQRQAPFALQKFLGERAGWKLMSWRKSLCLWDCLNRCLVIMQVAASIRGKSPQDCEVLHRKFRSFLSLPKPLLNVTAFLAVVKDTLKLESSEAETVSDNQLGRASSEGGDSDLVEGEEGEGEGEEDGAEEDQGSKPLRRSRRASHKTYSTQVQPCQGLDVVT